jgi:hypothetical protein
LEPWWADLYRLYYRTYYYGYAKGLLQRLVAVKVPPQEQLGVVWAQLDPQGRKHQSFLHVWCTQEIGPPKRWLFWQRKFAFSKNGGQDWWKLPSLTPWEWGTPYLPASNIIEIKYGLNQLFVLLHQQDLEYLTFAVWD